MSYATDKKWENLRYFPSDLMKVYKKVPKHPEKIKAIQDRKVQDPLLPGAV